MRRYRRVWVVYAKELVETLRDRRTLIAMVLVPVLLYPVLMIVLVQALQTEKGRRQTERYRVCVPGEAHRDWLRAVLAREEVERRAEQAFLEKTARDAGEEAPDAKAGLIAVLNAEQVEIDVLPPGRSPWDEVAAQKCHAAVLVEPPPDPEDPADRLNRLVQIVYCDTDPRSDFVYDQLTRILRHESERVVRARLARHADGEAILAPLPSMGVSTAGPQQQYAKILSMIVPFLLVVMTVTGAMYPAIDLTAGERERGTLETLAVAPVPVGQIVAGKFGVIVTIAMISTALNLGSMTAMVQVSRLERIAMSSELSKQAEELAVRAAIADNAASRSTVGALQRENLQRRQRLEEAARRGGAVLTKAAPIALVAMLPFAVLTSAVMLATCSFARTFKEAQNYMMPVMMAAIVPAMVVSYMPTIRLAGIMLVFPVANIVLLIRDLFLGHYEGSAVALCLLATSLYAAAAVSVAAKLYGHEAVLFSDVGSYKTLLLRRFIRPQATPSPEVALLAVAVIFPLYFYWQSFLVDADSTGTRFKIVIALSQVLILALPALGLAWYLKLDLRRTFSLAMPAPRAWLAAALLAVSIVPTSQLLQQVIGRWLPPGASADLLRRQADLLSSGSMAGTLLVLAVIPGVCEELLFRGWLLAAFRSRWRAVRSVCAVGVIFGVFHVYLEKIPLVSLWGILLALICLRGGSIFPAMLVHVANNALALAADRTLWLRSSLGLVEAAEADGVQPAVRTAAYLAVFAVGLIILWTVRPRAPA